MVPIVSIIMPVYNAEKTVSRMIDSIISQTFSEWELIVVDDGSTDDSGKIVDRYAASDSRINIIHKQNGGVSSARQNGIDQAKGEYVIHADADDWLESDMLFCLYSEAIIKNADVAICDFFSNKENKEALIKQKPSKENAEILFREMFKHIHGACWNKLVKKSCITKYNVIFYPEINYCEDFLFWTQLLLHSDVSIVYVDKPLYHYCENDSSITKTYNRTKYENRILFQKTLEQLLPHKGYEYELIESAFSIYLEGFINNVITQEEEKKGLNLYWNYIIHYTCLRWKVGFFLLKLGLDKMARKLITFE